MFCCCCFDARSGRRNTAGIVTRHVTAAVRTRAARSDRSERNRPVSRVEVKYSDKHKKCRSSETAPDVVLDGMKRTKSEKVKKVNKRSM